MTTRKLGAITGFLMIFPLFLGNVGTLSLHIIQIPTSATSTIQFFVWGFIDDANNAVNMLTLEWPSCIIAWITTISYMASLAMTIAASTPGSVPKNAKRMFILSAIYCLVHAMVYFFILAFSSIAGEIFNHLGLGFYALISFSIFNFISFAKVS
ncbi:MAG: hypothetical protein ACTSVI_12825 [Promethearchaeota archaeon]